MDQIRGAREQHYYLAKDERQVFFILQMREKRLLVVGLKADWLDQRLGLNAPFRMLPRQLNTLLSHKASHSGQRSKTTSMATSWLRDKSTYTNLSYLAIFHTLPARSSPTSRCGCRQSVSVYTVLSCKLESDQINNLLTTYICSQVVDNMQSF